MSESMVLKTNSKAPILPWYMLALFMAVVMTGIILLVVRDPMTVSSTLSAISDSDATLRGTESKWESSDDGLNDQYAVIQFKNNSADVSRYMELCRRNPGLALTIFRKALDAGNKSAKMVALHASFFLADAGEFDQQDLDRIVGALKQDAEPDVKKVAQRALSYLVSIKSSDVSRYENIPAGYTPSAKNTAPNKIDTKNEGTKDKPQYAVRWSNAELAVAWWESVAKTGTWDNAQKRFVLK